MAGRKITIWAGDVARIWKDSLNDHIPLCDQFHLLFNICNDLDCIVSQFNQVNDTTDFRRILGLDLLAQWHEMGACIDGLHLNSDPDTIY